MVEEVKKEIKNGFNNQNKSSSTIQDNYSNNDNLTSIILKLSEEYQQIYFDILDLLENKRVAEAMGLAQNLVDNNISNEAAWLLYACTKQAWGDLSLAKKGFEQAIAINPSFSVAYNDFGKMLFDNDDFEKAYFYFNKALEVDPLNQLYMKNVVLTTAYIESYESAIKKCKHFIDMLEDKTYMNNVLGSIYVYLSQEYVVDVPDDYRSGSTETTPGFISYEDIKDVRRYCGEAKSLLTLEEFKNEAEIADVLLKACDEDCMLYPCHKKFFTLFHALMVFIIYSFLTLIWGAPIALVIAILTVKADCFPQYVYNYVWCTGSDDPLKYSKDSFYKNHKLLKEMADAAKESWNDGGSHSFTGALMGGLFQSQIWFLKARWQLYKRFFREKKENRNG